MIYDLGSERQRGEDAGIGPASCQLMPEEPERLILETVCAGR